MAVSYVGESHFTTTSYTSSVPISKPAGVVDGDVLIAVVGGTPSTPSGWTLLGTANSGTSSLLNVRVFRKVASSEGSSYTFTVSSSLPCGAIVAYRGVDNATPVDTTNISIAAVGSGTNYNTASVTADGTQWSVTAAMGYEFGSSSNRTWTEGSGTERLDYTNAVSGQDNTSMSITDSNGAVSSGSFTRTQTRSASAAGGASISILLNSASTSASPTAGVATVTASTAFDATSAQGVAVLPGVANATCAALDGHPGVNAALLSSATAYNAAIALQGAPIAGLAEVTAAALNIGAHYGAPPGRTVKIGAESRLYRPSAESRVYVVETGGTD